MQRVSFGHGRVFVTRSKYPVPDTQARTPQLFQTGLDGDHIVVPNAFAETAVCLYDGEQVSTLLQFPVGEPGLAEQLRSCSFHPYEIAAVMGDPHLVGFCIAHAKIQTGTVHGMASENSHDTCTIGFGVKQRL